MRIKVLLVVIAFSAQLGAQRRDPIFIEAAVAPGRGWHCARVGRVGACTREAEECDALRQHFADRGRTARCVEQRVAFCTTWRDRDGETDAHCSPSRAACELVRRDYFAQNRAASVLGVGGQRSLISRCEPVGEVATSSGSADRLDQLTAASPPDAPSRDAVMSALRGVGEGVRRCPRPPRPVLTLTITFGSDGRVREVDFSNLGPGVPAEYTTCVDAAVRGARLAPFRRDQFRVTYPFSTVRD